LKNIASKNFLGHACEVLDFYRFLLFYYYLFLFQTLSIIHKKTSKENVNCVALLINSLNQFCAKSSQKKCLSTSKVAKQVWAKIVIAMIISNEPRS
jgi:hypothetical protein